MEFSLKKDVWAWPLVLAGHAALFAAVLGMGIDVVRQPDVPIVNVSLLVDDDVRVNEVKPDVTPQPKPQMTKLTPSIKPETKPVQQQTPTRTATPPEQVAAVKESKQETPTVMQSAVANDKAKPDAPAVANVASTSATGNEKSISEAADSKAAKMAEASTAPKKVSALSYLRAPQPQYPAASRRLNEQGKVLLKVMVDEAGKVMDVLVQDSSGFPRLDEAARKAVLNAAFRPYVENGRPLKAWALVPINFGLVEGGNNNE